jgi:hypothetical protein
MATLPLAYARLYPNTADAVLEMVRDALGLES